MLAIKHKESVRLGQKFQLVIAIKSAKGALFQSKILEIVPIWLVYLLRNGFLIEVGNPLPHS